jgi:hypothetical protein
LSTALVVDPFEEEEEGIGIACDVIKVQGEDPATPGSLRGNRVNNTLSNHFVGMCSLVHVEETPGNDSPISVK